MESHLLQMRGLKPTFVWNVTVAPGVASFTDAWIETSVLHTLHFPQKSHLLQMRGLKPPAARISAARLCRIFYRCVD